MISIYLPGAGWLSYDRTQDVGCFSKAEHDLLGQLAV